MKTKLRVCLIGLVWFRLLQGKIRKWGKGTGTGTGTSNRHE